MSVKSSFPSDGERDGKRPGLLVSLIRESVGQGRRAVRYFWSGLQAAGSVWVGPLPPQEPTPDDPAPRPMLDAPPAGHPERLASPTPPSPEEAELWARLHSDT